MNLTCSRCVNAPMRTLSPMVQSLMTVGPSMRTHLTSEGIAVRTEIAASHRGRQHCHKQSTCSHMVLPWSLTAPMSRNSMHIMISCLNNLALRCTGRLMHVCSWTRFCDLRLPIANFTGRTFQWSSSHRSESQRRLRFLFRSAPRWTKRSLQGP